MIEKFDFILSEENWVFEDDETTVFHANLVNNEYYVTWDESDIGAQYTVDEVSKYIKEKSWIVI